MSNVLTKKGLTFAAIGSLLLAGLTGVMPASAVTATLANLAPNSGSNYVSVGHSGVKIDTQISNAGAGVSAGDEDSLYLEFDIITLNSATYNSAQLNELFQNGTLQATLNGSPVDSFTFLNNTITLSTLISFDANSTVGTVNSVDVEGDWDLGLFVRADDSHNTIELQVSQTRLIDTGGTDITNTSTASVKLYDKSQVTGTTTITQAEVGLPLKSSLTLSPFDINTYFVSTDVAGSAFAYAAFFDTNSEARTDAAVYGTANDNADVLYAPVTSTAWNTNATNIALGIQGNYPLVATSVGNVPAVALNTTLNLSARSWYGKSSLDAATFTPSTQAAPTDFYQWLGVRSQSVAVTAGNNSIVDSSYPFVVDSKDLIGSANGADALVRSTVKNVTVNAQITATEAVSATNLTGDLAASGVSVRVTMTPTFTIPGSSALTIGGVTDPVTSGTAKSVILRTDAKGQVKVDLTNSAALAGDTVLVTVETRLVNGSWSAPVSQLLTWATPTVADFEVSTNNTSADSVSLTYTAYDQWFEGISSIGTGANNGLSVTVVGLDNNGGAFVKTALNETKPLVNGSATFTFANAAAVNTFVSYAGMLHLNAFTSANLTGPSSNAIYTIGSFQAFFGDAYFASRPAYQVTKVYKNAATDEVAGVENEYANRVVYMDFKTGVYGSTDRAFNSWHDTYGPGSQYDSDPTGGVTLVDRYRAADLEKVTVTGSVRTVGNAGAAFQAVTVSGAGTYFAVGSSRITYSVGSATVTTDANGNFSFTVFSHKENLAGLPITVTSGGKSFTTLLKTYMSKDIENEEYWNGAAWVDAAVLTTNWTKVTSGAPSLNTIYKVTATAKDVWGNPLRGNGFSNGAYITVNNGWALVSIVDGTPVRDGVAGAYTDSNGRIEFRVRTSIGTSNGFGGTVRTSPYAFGAMIEQYSYNDGSISLGYDFDTTIYNNNGEGYSSEINSGLFSVYAADFIGRQASAKAGSKAGVVVATVNNAKGKTVRVYVSGKLKKTVVADKTKFVTRVKGIKAGDKRVTVKVGKQRLFTGFITVK